jgi:hypothetical protein
MALKTIDILIYLVLSVCKFTKNVAQNGNIASGALISGKASGWDWFFYGEDERADKSIILLPLFNVSSA